MGGWDYLRQQFNVCMWVSSENVWFAPHTDAERTIDTTCCRAGDSGSGASLSTWAASNFARSSSDILRSRSATDWSPYMPSNSSNFDPESTRLVRKLLLAVGGGSCRGPPLWIRRRAQASSTQLPSLLEHLAAACSHHLAWMNHCWFAPEKFGSSPPCSLALSERGLMQKSSPHRRLRRTIAMNGPVPLLALRGFRHLDPEPEALEELPAGVSRP